MKIFTSMLVLYIVSANAMTTKTLVKNNMVSHYNFSFAPLDKFAGKWLWTDGKTTFLLLLEKRKFDLNKGGMVNVLLGAYQFSKNGTDIVNTLSTIKTNPVIYAGVLEDDSNKLEGTFKDATSGRLGHISLIYQEGSPPELVMEIKKTEMIIKPNTKTEFFIPTEFILKRVQ